MKFSADLKCAFDACGEGPWGEGPCGEGLPETDVVNSSCFMATLVVEPLSSMEEYADGIPLCMRLCMDDATVGLCAWKLFEPDHPIGTVSFILECLDKV